MDFNDGSDRSSDYNSDEIDSETEVRLYGAIHHTNRPEDLQQSITEVHNSGPDSTEKPLESMPKESGISIQSETICGQIKTTSDKPLNNLFRLLDKKLDESDEDFCEEFDFDFGKNINKNDKKINRRQIDVIDIDDSSDSDIAIIEDNILAKKSKPKQKSPKIQTNLLANEKDSSKSKKKIDIMFGNVNNLNRRSLEVMNEFYDEDNYDSEEEARSFSRMNGDTSLWQISRNDILLTKSKNNRYYRNRFICNNCNERGHQARDCPLPKKSPVCFKCGFNGHRSDRCLSILCSICLSSSHRTTNCNVSFSRVVCEVCGLKGRHQTNNCTYNWRKYHLTTTSSHEEPIISKLRPNHRKCCYNCGSIGTHFGFECHSKPMERRMIPVSVLMPNIRNSDCFNGRQRNNRRNDCSEKPLFNEFVKNISSNELSRLSASFNKPLDLVETMPSTIPSTSATTPSTFNKKNKHIKWIYPETNGTHLIASSYGCALNDSTPFIRICQQNRVIAGPTYQTILDANSTTSSALNTAHTLTSTQTHQQINNSMHEKSQTQTTPQLNERSKRRKNKRKKRKFDEIEAEDSEQQSFKQPNDSNSKPFRHFRNIKTNIKRFGHKKKQNIMI